MRVLFLLLNACYQITFATQCRISVRMNKPHFGIIETRYFLADSNMNTKKRKQYKLITKLIDAQFLANKLLDINITYYINKNVQQIFWIQRRYISFIKTHRALCSDVLLLPLPLTPIIQLQQPCSHSISIDSFIILIFKLLTIYGQFYSDLT